MYLYGVFFKRDGKHVFGLGWNKRNAKRFIRSVGNGEVRKVRDCPEIRVWDSHTFYMLSTLA